MSAFNSNGKIGVRCDTCGKFSMGKPTGEYTRKDGSVGYIWPEESALAGECDPNKDICEECAEGRANHFKNSKNAA